MKSYYQIKDIVLLQNITNLPLFVKSGTIIWRRDNSKYYVYCALINSEILETYYGTDGLIEYSLIDAINYYINEKYYIYG